MADMKVWDSFMTVEREIFVVVALAFSAAAATANAFEFCYPRGAQKPGIVLGTAAASPPPGLHSFDQVFTYQTRPTGLGAPVGPNGSAASTRGYGAGRSFFWVSGRSFLGATYDVVGRAAPVARRQRGAHTMQGVVVRQPGGVEMLSVLPIVNRYPLEGHGVAGKLLPSLA
jgi:hypothetical protein